MRETVQAFVDESGSHRDLDPNTYILGAVVVDLADLDEARSVAADLLLPGQMKTHWRAESTKRRMVLTEALVSAPVKHLVVIHTEPDVPGERRRRTCLKRLFPALSARGVVLATFESRGPADDKRDMNMLGHLRASKALDSSLRVSHRRGPDDPLLWLSDALCGVVTSARTGEPQYRELIEHKLTIM